MENQANNYYISCKAKLLKNFDKTASLLRDSVVSSYGLDFADTLYREVRQEYEELIPQIPHIEGIRGSLLNLFLRITAQGSVHRLLKIAYQQPICQYHQKMAIELVFFRFCQ